MDPNLSWTYMIDQKEAEFSRGISWKILLGFFSK